MLAFCCQPGKIISICLLTDAVTETLHVPFGACTFAAIRRRFQHYLEQCHKFDLGHTARSCKLSRYGMERDVHHHRPCIQYVASLTKALQQSQEYADRPFPKVQANVQPLQPAEQCITRISCVCTRQCGPSKNSRPVGSHLSAFGICRAILMLPHAVCLDPTNLCW